MITRKFFKMRKMTRSISKKYPLSDSYIEFYRYVDSDHEACFIFGKEDCLGEFSRKKLYEMRWL